ncbi:MAG: response regulator [Eubacteriaceae bacterium]|jgi:signal transduction histidine kinase/CheY-like chemotaxis protein/PAS domain-containing protein|nr:response regulator [Eubacteriaceae bacterium]
MAIEFNSIIGKISSFTCRVAVRNDDVHLIEASPQMFAFLGTNIDSYRSGILERISQDISSTTAEMLRINLRKHADSEDDFRIVYPSKRADGSLCILQMDAYSAGMDEHGDHIYDVIEMDITDLVKAKEDIESLNEVNKALTEDSPVGLGIYHIKGNHFNLIYTNAEYYRIHHGSKEYWDSFPGVDALDRIIKEDHPAIFEEWKRTLADPQNHIFDTCYRCRGEDGELHWVRLIARLSDMIVDGARVSYASYLDVDKEKQIQQEIDAQYMSAQAFIDSISDTYLATLRVNVTANKVETFTGPAGWTEGYVSNYDEFMRSIAHSMPRKRDRNDCIRLFTRETIITAYNSGTRSIIHDFVIRTLDGQAIWTRFRVSLTRRADTGDIIAFNAVNDITESKNLEIIMDKTLIKEHDFISAIDVSCNSISIISVNEQSANVEEIHDSIDYDALMHEYVYNHVVPDQIDACIEFMSLPNVLKALETDDTYTGDFVVLENGKIRDKHLLYSYIDRESGLLTLIRTDYTEIHKQQQEQEEQLRSALRSAEQANVAKSEFLSRMSHEIRTPMNAIIGLDTIALKESNLSSAMEDHLKKIGISARFLLSLINDILDMSRIESGKMLLKNDEFDFRRLIDSINAILYSQCENNGIDYDCVIVGYTDESYRGDELKLQQVLLNILGNSVKFTEPGGKIHFIIEQLSSDPAKAKLRFTIADTGCGIDEAFLPHLFDTFSQEEGGSTSSYGGTGLGLAISKSIVELMDGSINVHSVKGMGTDFTVEVTLGISAESHRRKLSLPPEDLRTFKTLIVDDDVIVCQHTKLVLDEVGIKSEWVTSGMSAIEKVRENKELHDDYKLILIDWKMPDMDGIETTRRIRKIAGPDVTILILTAYDWSEIEDIAVEAGVNNFMRKPVFASSILQAYDESRTHKIAESGELPSYDFGGRKILIVEDNIINAEIEKNLLEMVGFTVDLAENGVDAIKAFTESRDFEYAAILMDIRMPLMDGLEATKTIRAIKKKDSTTIPIIAMSANAFEEDVRMSLRSGMDAHLSKPIEAPLLYATIDKMLRTGRKVKK